jgi:phospholipid-binding lipoprotein MlaA
MVRLNNSFISLILLLALFGSVSGCSVFNQGKWKESDPFESLNRKVFIFNNHVDRLIMRPMARAYQTVVPQPLEDTIGRFFQNAGESSNFINHLLQLNFSSALVNFWRFTINSTVGVFGLFDMASKLGLPIEETDMGTTFALWGFRGGPYVVAPFFGPTTFWGSTGLLLDARYFSLWHLLDWQQDVELFALKALDARAQVLGYDVLIKEAFDPYIFVRNAYQQSRKHKWRRATQWVHEQYFELPHQLDYSEKGQVVYEPISKEPRLPHKTKKSRPSKIQPQKKLNHVVPSKVQSPIKQKQSVKKKTNTSAPSDVSIEN